MRRFITLVIFIIIAIGSYYFLHNLNQEGSVKKKTDEQFPDYFMDNFSITEMNLQGLPEYRINAVKMLHYADDDRAELDKPLLELTQPGSNVTLKASRAVYFQHENMVYLYDNVIIHRQPSALQSELFIYTDYLKLDAQTYIAETDLAVEIITPQAKINSIGMILDNTQGTLKLKSKVKGNYEPAH